MTRTIVGILRGGTSSEYNLSLKTGAAMIDALPQEKYETRDIFIDRSGMWHLRGSPTTPTRALAQIDVALNAVHGGIGEDGTIQRILEGSGIPYAGARALSAGLALNKIRAREILQRARIKMPRAISFTLHNDLNTADMARVVFAQFGPPYIIKPPSEGAGSGIQMAPHIVDLPEKIADVLDAYGAALVEEYIQGEEATVGLIENYRGEDLYALPPVHVEFEGSHIRLDHHEEGSIRHTVPSRFTDEQKRALIELARAAHRALDLLHFSRADLMVTPRSIYLLEINTVPGLYKGAAMPHMLESVGSSVSEFLEHAIHLAKNTR